MERLVAASIRRPVLVSMVVLAVLLLGAVSLTRMGLDLLPDIELPVVAVLTVYPGAGPEAVEQQVTAPIESALSTLPGVSSTSSVTRENLSLVIVELNWGTNLSVFINDVNQMIQRLRLALPASVQPPVVWRLDPTQLPIAMFGLVGSDGDDTARLTRMAHERVVPLLQRVEGVGRVLVSGSTEEEVQVRYDPEDLARFGLTPAQLTQLIAYQNVEVPVGALTDSGRRVQLRAGATLRSIDDLRQLPITILRPGQGGAGLLPQVVTVQDVAEVERVDREPEGFGRVNGRPSLLVSVFKESEHNTVTVARRIRKALADDRGNLDGLELVPIYNQADFIERSLVSVTRNGAVGAVLAVVLLYLFLFDVFSTFTVAVAIPISLVATLALMYLDGLTLNLMSLGGLGLGIGMLVDNAIVVLESIFRHAQQGEVPAEAARRGTAEVGMAITASTFTTLIVFLPVIFVGGLAGRLFKQLALTVSFSLLASLVVALTVVPTLAVRLRLAERPAIAERVAALAARRRLGPWWFDPVRRHYEALLRASLRRPAVVLGLVVAIVALAAWIYPRLDVEFLTPVDVGQLGVVLEMPPGTPIDRTDVAVRQLEAYLMRLPEVEVVATQVGSGGTDDLLSAVMADNPWVSKLYLVLKPRSQRSRSAAELVAALREELPRVLAASPEARIRVTDSPSFGLLSELVAERVTVDILGPDREALARLADQVADGLAGTPGLAGVTRSLEARAPAVALEVDPGRALTGGLLAAQVGMALRDAIQGAPAGQLVSEDGRPTPIVVKADPSAVGSLEALMDFPVAGLAMPGSTPPRVRLERIATLRDAQEPSTIQHRDGQRLATVTADLDGIGLGEAGRRVQEVLRSVEVPPGHQVRLSGIHDLIGETFGELWLALALSVVLVYMVMAAQFESLLDPLIIMLTVPLGLAGALVGLWLTRNDVGVTSILGGVVLAGIAVNNGIVLIDYINQVAARKGAWDEVVVEAASTRLRPVLMTALTTILGLFPLTLGWGEASELEVPLAVTVVSGMVLSAALTLFVVPVVKYVAGKLATERRAPAASLSVAPWVFMLVATGLLLLAFLIGSGRASASSGQQRAWPSSPQAAWWQHHNTSLGLGYSDPDTWGAGLASSGQVLRGSLQGATVQTIFGGGRTLSAEGPERNPTPVWYLQAGGVAKLRRLIGGVGLASGAVEAWLQATVDAASPPGGSGGPTPSGGPSVQLGGMGRLEGSVAAGNLALTTAVWAEGSDFSPTLGWLADGGTPARAVLGRTYARGSVGIALEGQRRMSTTLLRLGAGARYSPALGRVIPHFGAGATSRIGRSTLELAAAADLVSLQAAPFPLTLAASVSTSAGESTGIGGSGRPRRLDLVVWWEGSTHRLGTGLAISL